jgi:RNA12 protein
VASAHKADIKRSADSQEQQEYQRAQNARRYEGVLNGTWHDGRLDCVAGNGVMSELGIGDEPFSDVYDAVSIERYGSQDAKEGEDGDKEKKKEREKSQEEIDAIRVLPIVVIRNYSTKIGSTKDELLKTLADWAASLVENQVITLYHLL